MDKSEKKLFSVGLNHESCPLDMRGSLAVGPDEIDSALKRILEGGNATEAVILSTCNRTEIFGVSRTSKLLIDWLSSYSSTDQFELRKYIYTFDGIDVARHAFRVASGLDSMVLGETQILGQLKDAVRRADASGTLGAQLRSLFDMSFTVAKKVRTETEIGANSISLAAAAAKIAENIYGSLGNSKILFVGTGEMNKLCAEYFTARNHLGICFTNRTLSKAESFAKEFNGEYIPFSDLNFCLHEFDVVVSCTASVEPIIRKGPVSSAIRRRKRKPILFLDLAVPRDIEPAVGEVPDVFLYTVDDLGQIVSQGAENRQLASSEAEEIVSSGVLDYKLTLEKKRRAPVIRAFRKYGEELAREESARAIDQIRRGEDPEAVCRSMSRAITNKFLHRPSQALNNETEIEGAALLHALIKLYGLDGEK